MDAPILNEGEQVMAERRKAESEVLETMRPRLLECCVCLKAMKAGTSAMLPCFHSFHRACLAQQVAMLEKGGSQDQAALRCGVCGTEAATVTCVEDVDELSADLLAEAQLVANVNCTVCEAEKESDGDEVLPAVTQCTICQKRFCEHHQGLHKKKQAFATHVLRPLAVISAAASCVKHFDTMKMYCVTCAQVSCALCVVETHPQPAHQTVVLSDHVPELRKRIIDAHTASAQRTNELVGKLTNVRASLGAVDARSSALKDEVERTFSVIKQMLNSRKEALLREVDAEMTKERATLVAVQEGERQSWLTLEGAARMAEQLTAPKSSADHIGRLAMPVQAYLSAALREPVTVAPSATRIEFVVSDDVERVLSAVGRFVHFRSYGPECTAEGPGLSQVYVGVESQITVTARTQLKDRVITGDEVVKARLVSQEDSNMITAAVTDAGDGTYVVTYVMHTSGAYSLEIQLNGHPVCGSPFLVRAIDKMRFVYKGPPFYDNHGVIHHLATAGGTRPWSNPHDTQTVAVTMSRIPNGHLSAFVQNRAPSTTDSCSTSNDPLSWISVSLKGKQVIPTGYVLSIDSCGLQYGGGILRFWRLDGSVDGANWSTLREHGYDHSLSAYSPTGYWPILSQSTAYSHFRIIQTGLGSEYPPPYSTYPGVDSSRNALMATSFEIYGELVNP